MSRIEFSGGPDQLIESEPNQYGDFDVVANLAPRSFEDAERLRDCWNACAGLTAEQVAAIPRLVAWFRDDIVSVHDESELMEIFEEK
jgi:hypothetical protein